MSKKMSTGGSGVAETTVEYEVKWRIFEEWYGCNMDVERFEALRDAPGRILTQRGAIFTEYNAAYAATGRQCSLDIIHHRHEAYQIVQRTITEVEMTRSG